MIAFETDDLLEALRQIAREEGIAAFLDRAALDAALAEAARVADGRERDEPAAIFYAFIRRSRAFGPAAQLFVPGVAHAQALGLGFELDADAVVLSGWRAGVVRGEVTYEVLRGWFAERLRPVAR